jgi:hypothetical protein
LAVPSPRTWVNSEFVTKTLLDTEIRDSFNFLLAPPRCYAYKTANGSLVNATWDALSLTGELYDSHNAHDNTTNNTRIVAPEAGLYSIISHVTFTTDSAGVRGLDIRKNANAVQTGGTDLALVIIAGNGTTEARLIATVDATLNVNDYIEVFAYQSSGAALNVLGGAAALSFLSFRWVAKL